MLSPDDPLLGQGVVQIGELLLAFLLASAVGLERQLRGKSAGLRTQAIVGTTSALILIVSKYGFFDVLVGDRIVLDPSRIAAQIVSGIGFLGAGLILSRRGAIRGLTTAASVWETAAIGMAAGAGLWLLALVVTLIHFIVVIGYTALSRRLPGSRAGLVRLQVVYDVGSGVLRDVLAEATSSGWQLVRLVTDRHEPDEPNEPVTVTLELSGPAATDPLVRAIGTVDGVASVGVVDDDELD